MSRVQKLYERLDELQPRLEERLLAELDRVAGRGHSLYLRRRMTNYFDGRQYRRPEVAELEDLANEVIALKEKVGESLESGVTGIILLYEDFRDVLWDQRPHGEEEIELARRKAQELRCE